MGSPPQLSILYVGSFGEISTSRLRADAMRSIGLKVIPVEGDGPRPWTNLLVRSANRICGFPFQRKAVGRRLIEQAYAASPDIVWFDKAVFVGRKTLADLRRVGRPIFVHYNPDDPFGHARGFWSEFVAAIPSYDVHLVPRKENVPEYLSRGAKHVIPFDRGFCPQTHRPPNPSDPRWAEYGPPVAFTGSHERERAASIGRLMAAGIPVAIRGSFWNRAHNWSILRDHFRGSEVSGDEYALALGAPQITLHFLRHANRDEQDSRTFEIPACGGFMMAEWSPRHAELFEEDREAVFFRSDDELVEKVRHYLAHPEECSAIAARGRTRALESGYDYESRMRELLRKAVEAVARDDLQCRLAAATGSNFPATAPGCVTGSS